MHINKRVTVYENITSKFVNHVSLISFTCRKDICWYLKFFSTSILTSREKNTWRVPDNYLKLGENGFELWTFRSVGVFSSHRMKISHFFHYFIWKKCVFIGWTLRPPWLGSFVESLNFYFVILVIVFLYVPRSLLSRYELSRRFSSISKRAKLVRFVHICILYYEQKLQRRNLGFALRT